MIMPVQDWKDKTEVKKGTIGENIIRETLEKKGYIIYAPITTNKAHAFDFLAVKEKKVFIIAEIKTYARFNKFFATGINLTHFNEYKYIYEKQNIDIIIFFVDEHPKEERIYCQRLSVLMVEKIVDGIKYPNYNIANKKVLFSLTDMKVVCKLTNEQLIELKKYSNRKYEYA